MHEVILTPPTGEQLSPKNDRERLDLYLAAFLAESRRRHAGNPHIHLLYDRTAEFALRGGKRIRPRLSLASYRIVAGRLDSPPRPVWLASASLELFHAFMLVHDDLIDGSLTRRDHLALHEAIRLDAGQPDTPAGRKTAADLGLLSGDLLCALGMRMLSRSGLDDARMAKAQRLVADILLETGLGEALDVLYGGCPLEHLSEPHLVDAYVRKTARYSISGPLVLGATLAGAPSALLRALRRFGDLLGFGYQLQNDLDALEGPPTGSEHPDLDGGKRTWILWMAHQRLRDSGRLALAEALAAPVGPRRRERLWTLIQASGALDECRSRLASLRREAVETLREAPFSAWQRRSYLSLIELLPGKSRTSPPPLAGSSPVDGELFVTPCASELAGKASA